MLDIIQNHLFRYFTTVHLVSEVDAIKYFKEIVNFCEMSSEIQTSMESFTRQINIINNVIRQYDLEIMFGMDETNGNKMIAVVCTSENSITQRAKSYDKHTLEYFSVIVKEIVLSNNGHISGISCLNLNKSLSEPISKSAAELILGQLIQDKWLIDRNGEITLSVRSILELEPVMKSKFLNRMKNCVLCRNIVVMGNTCQECDNKIHFHCLKTYFERYKKEECPHCKQPWNSDDRNDHSIDETNYSPSKSKRARINHISDSSESD